MFERISGFVGVALVALTTVACGDRDAQWDAEPAELPPTAVGLAGSLAILDEPLDRVMMVTAGAERTASFRALKVGKNVSSVAASRDRDRLFVLAAGVQPRRNPEDELPSLTVVDGGTSPSVLARYELTDPLGGLAVDPQGEWVVVFDAGGIVVNPNELILVDLRTPDAEPFTKTIRSFGGRPQRLTFTSELTLPQGPPRRMLIVETEKDVTLVDLAFPERSEVTIALPQNTQGAEGRPAQVAFHDGDPGDPTDAQVAIRLQNDSNVVLVELGPPTEPDKDYRASVNVADVAGTPSAIDFVQTDGGLRLAALVPSRREAALIDPRTTVVDTVPLPGGYTQLARVTEQVPDAPDVSDVALLWGGSQSQGVAFWSLGVTTGKPFRSVESVEVGIAVSSVKDIPGEQLGFRKLLEGQSAAEFYVLDLEQRTSFPMLTNAQGFDVSISPDGRRAWALNPGTRQFARVDLDTLHPTSLEVERDTFGVYDIQANDGGRAAIALHANGTLGLTVLDALDPDTARSRFYGAVLLGGL